MNITSGKIPGAQKVLVYGPEGIGKSTFAAQFPEPLFIDTEGSTRHLDVRRLDTPTSWTMLMSEVAWVRANPASCKTLVIDTADWAEALCIAHVCAKAGKSGIEDFGYGKGYTYLVEEFALLLNALSDVIDAGVHVVLTAHAQITKFELPDEATGFDRWSLKLQKKTAPLVREWADMVLFANYKLLVVKNEDKKAKASGGQRVIYTSHRPAWEAKNRHGLADELPFEFASIAGALSIETDVPVMSPPAPAHAVTATPDASATAIEPASTPTPEASAALPPHLESLFQLMSMDQVSEQELRAAVHQRGVYPLATQIEKYDPAFVEGSLVAAWPQVLAVVEDVRKQEAAARAAANTPANAPF